MCFSQEEEKTAATLLLSRCYYSKIVQTPKTSSTNRCPPKAHPQCKTLDYISTTCK